MEICILKFGNTHDADRALQLFSGSNPEVIRRDLAAETEQRLHKFEDKVRASMQQVSP